MQKINAVEMREVARLKSFPRNARTHSKEQVEQLAAAIREFGFTAPILISPDGEIRAGHGRLQAAQSLGMTEVPTLVVGADWSPEKVRAYVIADNKLALNAGWDFDILAAEIGALQELDFDIALTGFSLDEIVALPFGIGGDGDAIGATPDRAPPRLGNLIERFGIPPFSVLTAREGWWQDRKRAWLALGIESEVGRGENLLRMSDTANEFMAPKHARGRRKPNAEPAGGGGGGWKAMNEKMAANRAKLRDRKSED